ncbi:MAG: penicillin acylase family protein [Spirochaetia bacterium]|nr:penicillin acylase family protein [Spirochaetia bacterium]
MADKKKEKKSKSLSKKKGITKSSGKDKNIVPISIEETEALFKAFQEIDSQSKKGELRFLKGFLRNKKIAAAISILFLFVSIYSYFFYVLSNSLPKTEGVIKLKGLKEKVIVRRDELGIPVINAQSESDLFFAAGYTMASERLWQMVSLTMLAQGRMSEIVGKEALTIDLFTRTIGIKRYAEKSFANLPENIKKILEDYARGVNAYLNENKELPVEFILTRHKPESWRAVDSIYISTFLSYTLSFNMIEELSFINIAQKLGLEKSALLFPIYHDEAIPYDEARKISNSDLISFNFYEFEKMGSHFDVLKIAGMPASNGWILNGKKTYGGAPILANDTHLFMAMPSIWIIMNLKSPTYGAAGVMFPGIPFIGLGYNGHIAWGATMVMADTQDVFVEKLKYENGKKNYLYKDSWFPVFEMKETIHIKNEKPMVFTVEFTRHGPLINKIFSPKKTNPLQPFNLNYETGLSHRWASADGDNSAVGIYLLAKSKSIEEARKAISYIDGMYFNMLLADKQNIAWQVTGKYPKRKKGKGLLPSAGYNGEYEWQGYHSYEKNPYSINPNENYIASANHKKIQNTEDFILTNSWYSKDRAERLEYLIENENSFDSKKITEMQMDVYSIYARETKEVILNSSLTEEIKNKAAKFGPLQNEKFNKSVEILKNFDNQMKANSSGAAFMGCFYHTFTRETFFDELNDKNLWKAFLNSNSRSYSTVQDHIINQTESVFFDNINTSEIETKSHVLALSLYKAYEYCEDNLGKNVEKWQWGNLHQYTLKHAFTEEVPALGYFFNRGPYPAPGDFHTLNVAGFFSGEDFSVFHIPAMRFIVDFNKEDPASLVTYTGQSGNFMSENYDDMIDYFLSGKNHSMPYLEKNIIEQYKKTLILESAK